MFICNAKVLRFELFIFSLPGFLPRQVYDDTVQLRLLLRLLRFRSIRQFLRQYEILRFRRRRFSLSVKHVDVFYLHSRLLERAAKLSNELGGGSLTALPIIETQAGDVSAYIPTNVISITDGQIFLETELFHSGVMPAVNPGISVSRVGGNAQIKAMKKVAGTLKLIYSQYRELQSFAQFGSDLDADTKARLAQGERIVEVLKQNRSAPVPVEKQVAILYATIHDLLVKVKVADVAEYEKGLYEYLENDAAGAAVMETIRTTGNLDKDTEEALKGVLSAYTESFVKAH